MESALPEQPDSSAPAHTQFTHARKRTSRSIREQAIDFARKAHIPTHWSKTNRKVKYYGSLRVVLVQLGSWCGDGYDFHCAPILDDYVDRKGKKQPGILHATGLNVNQYRKALHTLSRLGLIERTRKGNQHYPTQYRLNINAPLRSFFQEELPLENRTEMGMSKTEDMPLGHELHTEDMPQGHELHTEDMPQGHELTPPTYMEINKEDRNKKDEGRSMQLSSPATPADPVLISALSPLAACLSARLHIEPPLEASDLQPHLSADIDVAGWRTDDLVDEVVSAVEREDAIGSIEAFITAVISDRCRRGRVRRTWRKPPREMYKRRPKLY